MDLLCTIMLYLYCNIRIFLTIALIAVNNYAILEHIQFWTIGESHRGSKEDPDSRFD